MLVLVLGWCWAGVPAPRGPASGWLQMLVTLNMFNVSVMGGGKLQT